MFGCNDLGKRGQGQGGDQVNSPLDLRLGETDDLSLENTRLEFHDLQFLWLLGDLRLPPLSCGGEREMRGRIKTGRITIMQSPPSPQSLLTSHNEGCLRADLIDVIHTLES